MEWKLWRKLCSNIRAKRSKCSFRKAFWSSQIVNDGVTIAKEISLEDHIENTGVSLIRQAAAKTNDVAGDGTTTATVLAYAIVKEGMRNVTAGANPISLKIGIEKAIKYLVESIIESSRPIDSLECYFSSCKYFSW